MKASVEKWRGLAEEECARVSCGFTPNLVLSIVQQESGGKVGVKAYVIAGDGTYAMGLMQCIGSVTQDYNKIHGTLYNHAEVMGGTSYEAARIQLRVGIWLVRRKQAQVREWLRARIGGEPAHRDVVCLADCAYAMGWGALKKKLAVLQQEALPLTFDALKERFPTWGYSERRQRWINRPLHHAETIWERYQAAEAAHPYGELDPADGEGADVEPVTPPYVPPPDSEVPLPSDEIQQPVAGSAVSDVVKGAVILGVLGVVAGVLFFLIAKG